MSRPARPARLIAGAILVGSLALAGCGRADDAASSGATSSIDDSPATGAIAVWAPDGDANVLEEVIAPFLEDNPDADVEITLVPESEYTTKLRSAISAGSGPDVALLYTESQAQFTRTGAFAPVPDGVADADAFFDGAWDAGVIDGAAYSVPWYSYTYALVYRADLAAAAGASAPETWDDMVPFFESLESAGAVRGFAADVGWDVYTGQLVAQLLWQAGGELLTDDGAQWTLDTPEMVAAIEHDASFFTSGSADTATPLFLDSQPYFVEGKTASSITGPWVIGQYDDVAGEEGWTAENVGTAPLPAGDGGSVGALAGGSWGVLDDSENPDSAWKLIRFLAEEDTQLTQYEAYSSLPAVESAWEDPAISGEPLLDAFFTQLQTAKTYPQSTTWPQVVTQLGAEMEGVAKGAQTAEEAAANIQAFAESLGTGSE
ncbi:extracellular solute-binding protein [Microbacterium betulae]|uniref:Extracellular solute-binding protein n=1 Tax=Microbacterium betulae TaxID=2981139 RepID=A0AA97I4T5_9MICO|nr:extracellular solute-binding protein [Microbacterium sp. AB]WOF22936.1 extracellular solute-binding protein [Microbacterium sp. AB]